MVLLKLIKGLIDGKGESKTDLFLSGTGFSTRKVEWDGKGALR